MDRPQTPALTDQRPVLFRLADNQIIHTIAAGGEPVLLIAVTDHQCLRRRAACVRKNHCDAFGVWLHGADARIG